VDSAVPSDTVIELLGERVGHRGRSLRAGECKVNRETRTESETESEAESEAESESETESESEAESETESETESESESETESETESEAESETESESEAEAGAAPACDACHLKSGAERCSDCEWTPNAADDAAAPV
jgi:hypothetical protein